MKRIFIASTAVAVLLTGCASRIDTKNVDTLSCQQLDEAIGQLALQISDTAVARGKADPASVPFWIPGGAKAVSAIRDRQTRKLERLQDQQKRLTQARGTRCRSTG
jgi:hypothetical protein